MIKVSKSKMLKISTSIITNIKNKELKYIMIRLERENKTDEIAICVGDKNYKAIMEMINNEA